MGWPIVPLVSGMCPSFLMVSFYNTTEETFDEA
jgi:hypothetical protein